MHALISAPDLTEVDAFCDVWSVDVMSGSTCVIETKQLVGLNCVLQ